MQRAADRGRRMMTLDDLMGELAGVTSRGNARALLARARRVTGVRSDDLEVRELLMVLETVASEGGALQEFAEALSRRALESPERRPGADE